jgi:hypothetical protein
MKLHKLRAAWQYGQALARREAAWIAVALAGALAALPRPALGEVVSLHEMLGNAGTALGVLMAEAEFDAAEADWERARSEQGWKLSVAAGYGTQRDLIDESRARTFDAIRTEVTLAYPLLGAHALGERDIEVAAGKVSEARIRRDSALKIAELQLEDVYAALWGAQESLEVIDAYLLLAQRLAPGTADPAGGNARVTADQRRLSHRRDAARARLEELSGRKLAGLVATGVQLPQVPPVDLKRLEQDHPDLAELRAAHRSARAQLDSSVWYGIDAAFDITQTTLQDRDGGQAGNGLYANFNVSVPLTFYQAGLSERRKLKAEMDFLELKLRDKGAEIAAKARDSEAQYMDLRDAMELASQRAREVAAKLRAAGRRPAAALLRDYYARAMEEIEARTRYWRAHVELRSFVPVGAAEPAPEPTGPAIADVGTRLAEPLLKAAAGG